MRSLLKSKFDDLHILAYFNHNFFHLLDSAIVCDRKNIYKTDINTIQNLNCSIKFMKVTYKPHNNNTNNK